MCMLYNWGSVAQRRSEHYAVEFQGENECYEFSFTSILKFTCRTV